MMNAFVPVLIIYILALIMVPVFQRARENAERRQKQQTPAVSITNSSKR